ncbi:MAG: Fe-S cluster assembly ATPase SufC, partial [Bacteroidales bacterium]|nr:Fe-S cluster assembly ATPase SufC [Bacteroidales bacterium]
VFLGFQYPVEIPGVSNTMMLKSAVTAQRKAKGLPELSGAEFLKLINSKLPLVNMNKSFLSRGVNVGFSGGEKKRNEVLQMAVLEPQLAILDETDSGLDVDALRIVGEGVDSLRTADNAFIVITHYQRLLDYIVPDVIHVLYDGRIIMTGGRELAREIEAKGYDWIIKNNG